MRINLCFGRASRFQEVPCQQTETETRAVPFRSLSASDILWQAGRQAGPRNEQIAIYDERRLDWFSLDWGSFSGNGRGNPGRREKEKNLRSRAIDRLSE